MKKEKREFVGSQDGLDFRIFKPSLFRLYDSVYAAEDEPPYFHRLVHRLRMMRELLKAGYRVVYFSMDGGCVGHLVVGRGGTRIAMSTPEDIVIGPVWIVPSRRNRGYASKAIHFVLHSGLFPYVNAYEFISQSNTASIRTVEKNGFVLAARCSEHGLMRTLREDASGRQLIYRYRASK